MEAAMDDRENIMCVKLNSAEDLRCHLKAMSGEVLCEKHLLEKQEARKRKMIEEGMGLVPGARKKGRPSGSKNKPVEGTGEVPAGGIRKRGRPKGSKKGRGRGRPKGSKNKKKPVNGTEESVEEMKVDPRGSGEAFGVTSGAGVREVLQRSLNLLLKIWPLLVEASIQGVCVKEEDVQKAIFEEDGRI